MKKKWIILLVLILAIIIVGMGWGSLRRQRPIRITGNVTAQDVKEITALVKRDLERRVFPDLSWKSFKGLMGNGKNLLRYEIIEAVRATNSPSCLVGVRIPGSGGGKGADMRAYWLSNKPGRWTLFLIEGPFPDWQKYAKERIDTINRLNQALVQGGQRRSSPVRDTGVVPSGQFPGLLVASNKSLMGRTDLTLDRGRDERPRITVTAAYPAYPRVAPALPLSVTNFVPGR